MAIPKLNPKEPVAETAPETAPETATAQLVVFDAGASNSMSINDCHFVDGVFITDDPEKAGIIRNFIDQTHSRWREEAFDATNPRHLRAGSTLNKLIVHGISDPLSAGPSTLTSTLLAGGAVNSAAGEGSDTSGSGEGATE